MTWWILSIIIDWDICICINEQFWMINMRAIMIHVHGDGCRYIIICIYSWYDDDMEIYQR